MNIEVIGEAGTRQLAEKIGRLLKGGEVIELIGDIGAGKTTFVKGLAKGLAISEDIQSPSFTVSRVYNGRNDIQLVHYDFYRLSDPGIIRNELAELIQDPRTITVIEWADIVNDVLPEDRQQFRFSTPHENSRKIDLDDIYQKILI